MAYKTPGVYVEEKSVFPPSVAQVETAIPAFIGYTEKADERLKGDLDRKPKKVSSLLEYRQYFGGPPPLNISKVTLDGNNALKEALVEPQFYMFDSLQLFFMNGGGDCYIVSVGLYESGGVNFDSLNEGLDKLEKTDEPTIILFPDTALLEDEQEMYTLQKNALTQCNKLMDRVAIFDLRNKVYIESVESFRNNIGTNFLKYGAAYMPYLKTNLPKEIKYKDIRNNAINSGRFNRSGSPITLDILTSDDEIKTLISELDKTVDDVERIAKDTTELSESLFSKKTNLREAFDSLYTKAVTDKSIVSYKAALNSLYRIVLLADKFIFAPQVTTLEFQTAAEQDIFPDIDALVTALITFDKAADASNLADGEDGKFNLFKNYTASITQTNKYTASWGDDPPPDAGAIFEGEEQPDKIKKSLPSINNLFQQLIVSVDALVALGNSRMKTKEDSLLEQFPVYKNLLKELNQTLSTIPPSGAIAGVYAQVDANRGVWKAPANVSLNGVSDLTEHFTQSETDNLNVDTGFGKSINAIKFITGMGFMVWGARTLAGNDNEWRYIPVRRFFNMVEESVKKSTMWAVFEPNDANTWVKVKGMIDNFLTLQWRNGALQGAKPEEAFFVKIGLGQTMTAVDILEGRMNVEIGMAVVRPAEFIILTFSHKMVSS